MSIADKITSITNHLTSDYEGIENLGVDLTNIDKNIQNIRTCLDTIYTNLPKVTGTDGTEVTLTPTLKGKLNIQEKGNSTQEPLDNLFNINDNLSLNNATLLDNDYIKIGYDNTSGSSVAYCSAYTNNLNIQTSTKYLIVAEILEANGIGTFYLTQRNEPNNRGQFFANSYNIQSLSAGDIIIIESTSISDFTGTTRGLNTTAQISSGRSGFVTFRLSVLADTSITASTFYYCPYGATSPTPSYPFPIKSVTGNNNVVVKTPNLFTGLVKGKGLNDNTGTETTSSVKAVSDYIPVDFSTNTNYTVSGLTDTLRSYIWAYNSNKQGLHRTSGQAQTSITFNSSSFTNGTAQGTGDIAYIRIQQYEVSGQTTGTIDDIDNLQIMLNEGSSALPYQPYGNQTLPLNLGSIELNKIGDYQDYIYKNNGNWYKKSNVGKYTFTGEESFTENTTGTKFTQTTWANVGITNYTNTISGLCSKFVWKNIGAGNSDIGFYYTASSIRFRPSTSYTSQEFLALIVGTIIYYALATPQDIQIIDTTLIEQLEAIDKAQSYNGTTIITSTYDSSNAQMILGASALKGE